MLPRQAPPSLIDLSRRRSPDLFVRQEREQQLVVGGERTPAGRWWLGEERCADLSCSVLMSIWGVGNPRTERLGDFEAVGVIQHGRPAVGETFGQLAHKYVANKACDLLALLRLAKQSAQYLHCCNVILSKLFGQQVQRDGRTRLGKGGERIVAVLADPLIQACLHVALPGTLVAHRPLQRVKFIGIL
ncbi:hypothetical protein MXAN_4477 [Myxococcus xanthus DK 1622]|uniref:Uncharacterized protein n=1 Tax=Myxococcus xanthus (strain DK1622) TaxID=246197 RepID=Q1D3X8_MYXXD|nr:hypothetical protein MXAN_4477 [Myxococcus xanthus DK 1622]